MKTKLTSDQQALLNQVSGFWLQGESASIGTCAMALGWERPRAGAVMLELEQLGLVEGASQRAQA